MVFLFHWLSKMKLFRAVVSILVTLFGLWPLVGCEQDVSYAYLITHPADLKAEVLACQAHSSALLDQSARCDLVMKAATDFEARVEIASADPEKFGADLLTKQEACAMKKDEAACWSAKIDLAVLSLSTPT